MNKNKVIEIAHKHAIYVKEDSLTFNQSGLDFLVVFAEDAVGERWVLRFPRREDVLPSADKEKRTLDLIVPRIAVEVPQWRVYTDELIAYRQLTGVPAGTIDHEAMAYVWEIDEKNVPSVFTKTLAEAMVSLHRIQSKAVETANLPVENAEEARKNMMKRMENVRAEFDVNEKLWKRWQDWVNNDTLWPAETCLVHGDLHAGHILIHSSARVTGIIDWTEASVTDPANDFVPHLRTFGEQALRDLILQYEQAGGYVWPNMEKHIIELTAAYPIGIAEFAQKSGLEEYKQMAKQVLGGNQ